MLLSWQTALKMAIALVVLAVALSALRLHRRWAKPVIATSKELSLVLGLYALWQYAHDLAITKVEGAHENALWLYRLEQDMHLPSEVTLQNALINHKLVMQFLNIYYGGMHVPVMGIVLIWLFFRHRERYARVRTSLALMIAGCLTIQMIPMAPPRFLPELGFVDAGLKYGLSVYGRGGSGLSNQLAAKFTSSSTTKGRLANSTAKIIRRSRAEQCLPCARRTTRPRRCSNSTIRSKNSNALKGW